MRATPPKPYGRHSGFTLLELLVVLVLIGIIIGVAVLSLGDGGRGDAIREEGRRLVALMELAGDEAVLNTRPYGLALREKGFDFMVHQDGQWRTLEDDDLLGPRRWPPQVEVALYIDGHEVALDNGSRAEEEKEEPRPAVVFYPDGERSAAELELAYSEPPQLRQRITLPPFGEITQKSVLAGEFQ